MPRVSRSRTIAADPGRVWDLISDPHSLPRWWPRTQRVEDVRNPGGQRAHWTTVLGTERGTGVRADFRCTAATEGLRYVWEQEVEGTPFERILKASTLEIGLDSERGSTRVTLTSEAEPSRWLHKLTTALARRFYTRQLEAALEARTTGSVRVVLVTIRYDTDGSQRLPDTSTGHLAEMSGLLGAVFPVSGLDVTGEPSFPRLHGSDFWAWLAEHPGVR